MQQRFDYFSGSTFFKNYLGFDRAVHESAVAREFGDLATIRASHMNQCAFCLDMHVKEAKIHGERELRIYHLPVWRESNLFTPRERAALAWTEALTALGAHGVPDDVYAEVRSQLSETEMADLGFLIVAINGWNRLCIAFRTTPGSADAAFGLDKAGLS